MSEKTQASRDRSTVFTYRGVLPPALALLVAVPLLFVLLSVAAVALTVGALAAVFLPIVLRGRRQRTRHDTECIELERDQYSRVDADVRRLPPV